MPAGAILSKAIMQEIDLYEEGAEDDKEEAEMVGKQDPVMPPFVFFLISYGVFLFPLYQDKKGKFPSPTQRPASRKHRSVTDGGGTHSSFSLFLSHSLPLTTI